MVDETNYEERADDEEYDGLPSSNGTRFNSKTGFRNIVRRLQLAARVSNATRDEKHDEFRENLDINRTVYNNTKRSIRRRSTALSIKRTSRSSNVSQNSSYINEVLNNRYFNGEIRFLNEERQLEDVWQLEMPKIITFVITNKSHKTQWHNKKQIGNFQKGIAKAAISTNMWIITNGLNCGATSYICSAIENELIKIRLKQFSSIETAPLLFGICHASDLTYGDSLSDFNCSQNVVCLENQGFSTGTQFELNPHHSHYIVVKNSQDCNELYTFTNNLIHMLLKGEEFYETPINMEIPLVSILIDGEPENINFVLSLIKKQIPVVVLQGSGGLADIVAYAYNRIWDAFDDLTTWDTEYIDDYVKPWLAKKIGDRFSYLKRNSLMCNILRDQVIQCVRLSKQNGREHFLILDMFKPHCCDLTNLTEHLLNALLRSRRHLHCATQEQILKDIDLTMDWNCATVANNLLVTLKNNSKTTEQIQRKFFAVLTRHNREQFIDIFLRLGFEMHKFLTPSRLSRLFRTIHDDEFFKMVCWESALGQASNSKQSKYFIESDLNWLIQFCTGLDDYVNTEDLHRNSLSLYTIDSLSAERKALTLVAIWAVMQNRSELAKVLWKYCDHPVHLALIISIAFERLSWNVIDTNVKAEMKHKSKQFADYANGVLDKCYNVNISQAYNVLRESIKDWNYMTAVDIAASGKLKRFIAHPCCQKWLTNTFQGKIRLREITWGFFSLPVSIKVLLCSLLAFPMYIWVQFKEHHRESNCEQNELDDDFDVYESMYTHLDYGASKETNRIENVNVQLSTIVSNNNNNNNLTQQFESPITIGPMTSSVSSVSSGIVNKAFEHRDHPTTRFEMNVHRREMFVHKQPPLWKMIQMMWGSPITKFYNSELFYVIYLILISIATLYPNCGNVALDSIICVWTYLFVISRIRHTYVLVIRYSSIPIYSRIIETLLMFSFATFLAVTRVLRIYFYPVYWQKSVMCLAILYFYYNLIAIYLPISPSLGPLLRRFRLMITNDFTNFMRITLVILVSNSIVMHALEWPYQTMTSNSWTNVIHEGMQSLFNMPPNNITVKTDLRNKEVYCPLDGNGNDKSNNKVVVETSTLSTSTSSAYNGKSVIEEQSLILYLFLYQYYIVLKLIAQPLLFSIFAVTASKWVQEIDVIWKYQRYNLVIEFANRLPIPEPFSLINKSATSQRAQYIITPDDCLCWKQLASEFVEQEKEKCEELQIKYKEWECIQEISEEIEYEKKMLREIKCKIAELDKNLKSNGGGGSRGDRSAKLTNETTIRRQSCECTMPSKGKEA
ncbi:hypothetical protein BLOT_006558 [Blomia tropicalis]|nr:hypothetical protein BLOT_006558 [Blomia tropicalis]